VAKEKLKVKIRIYEETEVRISGVTIGALSLVEEKEIDALGDPLDVLMRVSEEQARARKGSYVEVVIQGSDATYIMGESPRYRWRRRLTMSPERLVRVGIVKQGKVEGEGSGLIRFKLNEVTWRRAPKNLYVFEGRVEAGEEVALVILETESSRAYVRPVTLQRRSSRSPG